MADPLRAWILKKKSTLGPIAGAVAVIWIISRLPAYITARSNNSKLPSPRFALPYVGHLFNLGSNTMKTFSHWHQRYGPIILIQMGVKQMVSISDPLIAHEVFGTKGTLAANRPYNKYTTKIYSHNGKGIVHANTNRKSWRRVRGIAITILGQNHVIKNFPDMCNETEQLVNALATGDNIDPSPHISRLSLNYMTLSLYGIRTTSTEDPIFKKCVHLIDQSRTFTDIKYVISEYLPVLSFVDHLINDEANYAKHIETERDAWIREWMLDAHKNGRECVATALLESVHTGDIDEATAIVTLSDLIFAGMDTTAVTIGWAFGILSVKPD
ncbi:cytochrome P450, partial [Lichtheimia hyalospora FSU 10163]